MMKFPFEAKPDVVLAAPESFVDVVFSSLASEFLVMPKGAKGKVFTPKTLDRLVDCSALSDFRTKKN
jgi:hypothetical protein